MKNDEKRKLVKLKDFDGVYYLIYLEHVAKELRPLMIKLSKHRDFRAFQSVKFKTFSTW